MEGLAKGFFGGSFTSGVLRCRNHAGNTMDFIE